MTEFDGTGEEDERRFGRGRYPRIAAPPGHWVYTLLGLLGAFVLSGHLMTGHPSTWLRRRPHCLPMRRWNPRNFRRSSR